MNRRNEILVVALVAQVVLILLITTLRAPAASAPAKPLFEGVKATDVQALTVQDNSGSRIDLSQKSGQWALSASDDFPADNTKVNAFIDKLLKVQSGRLIAQTANSYTRLQVADTTYARKIEIKLADGKTHVLLVGSSAGGNAVHVRANGAAEVWLTESLNSTDASASAVDWINPVILSTPIDKVIGATITNHNGKFEFTKANNVWAMKGLSTGETFDATKFAEMITRLSSLSITRPLGKAPKSEYGLQPPTATLTLTLQQDATTAKPIVVQIGAKDTKDNTYTVLTSESPYYVRVSEVSLDDFVAHTHKDFLVPPPTAVPTMTVTPAQ